MDSILEVKCTNECILRGENVVLKAWWKKKKPSLGFDYWPPNRVDRSIVRLYFTTLFLELLPPIQGRGVGGWGGSNTPSSVTLQ